MARKTEVWAIMLVLLMTGLTSIAQLFWKIGVDKMEVSLLGIATNMHLIVGVILYGGAAAMLIIALKGGELSVLYPLVATSFLWVSLLSIVFLGETMNLLRWLGVIAIVLGVALTGMGSE